jgi:hypothetical protein
MGEVPLGASPEGLVVLPAGVFEIDGIEPLNEGDAVTVTVRRRDGAFGAVSVRVGVETRTAGDGDVDRSGGVLTFAEGETTKTLTIATREDGAFESAEDAWVQLSNPTGGAILGPNDGAALIIRDDDPAPTPTPVPVTTPLATPSPRATARRSAPLVLAVPPRRVGRRALRRSGLPLTVACAESCTLTVQLRDGSRVLGSVTVRLPRPVARRLRVRLSRAGRRLLRRQRRLTLRMRAVGTTGVARTQNLTVRLTR